MNTTPSTLETVFEALLLCIGVVGAGFTLGFLLCLLFLSVFR